MLLALVVVMTACQQKKIGYVDNVKLMDSYQEKMDVEAKFKAKAENLTRKRDSISQAFQLELQEFQAKPRDWLRTKHRKNMGYCNSAVNLWGSNYSRKNSRSNKKARLKWIA